MGFQQKTAWFCRTPALAAAMLLTGYSLNAQIGGTGSIQGLITDPTGAAIPNVTVVATNVATGVSTTRQSTQAGYYVVSPLQPGTYTVTTNAPGFQKVTQGNVVVDALAQVGLNLTLPVGAATQEVTVSAAPPQLNTADASMGQTMRNELYDTLPLQMGNAPRDPTAFTQLMPGVSTSSATGNTAGNVLGSQEHSQEIYIEGLPTTNPALEGESRTLGLGVSVEAVDQFQLESAGTSVQYQGQGASNFVVKSGTNEIHGAAYEYLRNTAFDARGFFASGTVPEHQHEFGFNIGGPIVRNKAFFFANYDGFRFTQQTRPTLASIPTLAERSGDFSALLPSIRIYDPVSTVCNPTCTRTAFAGNTIPASRISPISQFLQSLLPNPDAGNNNVQNNYTESQRTGYHDNSTTDKVDFTLNEKNTFYVLFSHGHRSQTTPYRGTTLPLPYADTRLVDEYPTIALTKWTFTPTPSLVNELSYGFSRFAVPIADATIAGNWANKAGLRGLPVGAAASGFPEISWSGPQVPDGWRRPNTGASGSEAFNDIDNTFTLQDNLQWIRGKHSVTFGGQMQWLQANEKERTYGSIASWNFSNVQTAGFSSTGTVLTTQGNAYASFLLGAVNSNNVVQDSVVEVGGRYKDFSWWLQDNYKVTPRLTLNLGLRHDIWGPYKEVLNRQSFFNPTVPNPIVAGYPGSLQFYGGGPDSCHCDTTIATRYLNLGPRIGLAFSMTNTTVVRAGYSIMYAHRGAVGGRNGGRTGTDILGFSASPNFTTVNGYAPAYNWDGGVPSYTAPPFFNSTFGTGFYLDPQGNKITTASTLNYGDPTLGGQPPRYQNWNLALEHSFTSKLMTGAAYVGSNGHFLGGGGRGIWSDQIDPTYLALGNLLTQNVAPNVLAQANAIIPGIRLPYANFTGSLSQMLRPWPQYSGITDLWGDVGNSNYNSLQLYAVQRLSHGLTFNINYVFARAFDDTGSNMVTNQSGTLETAYNWRIEKAMTQLPAHSVNLFATYQLPVGKGRQFVNNRRVLSQLLGGWQLSGIWTYRSGLPIGTILTSSCNVPNAGGCFANYNPNFTGPVRINGSWGNGNLIGPNTTPFLNVNAFVTPPAYTYGNTPRTNVDGIRNPSTYDIDLNLRREFTIHESIRVIFQADAFNIFNLVNFSPPSTNVSSTSFGKITSQVNAPRTLQLSARLTF